jgi:hypothetical protein
MGSTISGEGRGGGGEPVAESRESEKTEETDDASEFEFEFGGLALGKAKRSFCTGSRGDEVACGVEWWND